MDRQWELMNDAENVKSVLCDSLEVGGFRREGNMDACGRFTLVYGKNHPSIVK